MSTNDAAGLVEALPSAVIIVDAHGRIYGANQRAEELFGYSGSELIGQNLTMLLRLQQPATLASLLAERGDLPLAAESECVGRRKDGVEILMDVALSRIQTADNPLAVAIVRPRTPESAEYDAPRTPSELDYTGACIVRVDASGCITHVNGVWRQFAHDNAAGEALSAGIGQNYLEVCQRSDDKCAGDVAKAIDSILSGRRETFDIEYSCHSPTRLRWFRLEGRQARKVGEGAVLTHIDVTQEHLSEARSRIQGCVADAFASRKSLPEVCRTLARVACEELEWDCAGIWQLDPAAWMLHCTDVWTRPTLDLRQFEASARAARFAPGEGLPGRVWAARQALWVTDFDEVDVPAETLIPKAALAAGFRSGFAFPVKYDDDVLAVIDVFGRIRQAPDPALLHLLETSGVQVATAELRDRAERRAEGAQIEADAAREQLEAVLQCVPALVLAIDRSGALRFVNKPSPVAPDPSSGDGSWRDHFPPEAHARIESAVQAVLAGGPATHHDVALVAAKGDRSWATNYVVPIRSAAEITGALIVSHDVTQIKLAQAELFDAQRLAAIGTLAAGVAHEINTPIQFVGDNISFLRDASADLFGILNTFQAFRQEVQASTPSPQLQAAVATTLAAEQRADLAYLLEQVPEAFSGCSDGLERVSTIVRSMKEFSHPSEKEMSAVDLNRAIMATLVVARSEYKYVADLETDLGELPPITCHVNEINQVVLNIVVNAAHAIADRHGAAKGLITLRTHVDGPNVVITISDTGGGIPEAIRHRVFEPFFTTKEVGRGTGQGLAIAWAAIKEKHDGELSFETRPGDGTTFFIRLPIEGRLAPRQKVTATAGDDSELDAC